VALLVPQAVAHAVVLAQIKLFAQAAGEPVPGQAPPEPLHRLAGVNWLVVVLHDAARHTVVPE
jgi:hypothetical protein